MIEPSSMGAPASDSWSSLAGVGDVLELGLLTLGTDLQVRDCNRWLATAMGTTVKDLVGRSVLDVFPELAGGPAEAAFRSALAGTPTVWSNQFHGYLLPLPPPAGHEQFARMQQSAQIVPLQREGQVDGVLTLVQDVTERVAHARALRQALRDAEVASQAKSDFLASMSHELRTPLSAIVGYMELLLGDIVGPVPDAQRAYLVRVGAAARHLMRIIEEILTFSRVEAGKEPMRMEDVDLAVLARDVGQMLEPEATRKGLKLDVVLPSDAVPARTDATKVRQVLINLLGNAVKFTEQGRVTLEMGHEGSRIVFDVRDTGPGILPDNLSRIFDPFTQLDQSLRRTQGGTGLGLPVSLRLAHLLDGDITVQSVRGEGSVFTFWFPLAPPAPAGSEPAAARR